MAFAGHQIATLQACKFLFFSLIGSGQSWNDEWLDRPLNQRLPQKAEPFSPMLYLERFLHNFSIVLQNLHSSRDHP